MRGVIVSVDVLTHVYAVGLKVRQERFEGLDLLVSLMAAIVEHYIDPGCLLDKGCPELRVSLVTDEDARVIRFVCFARGFDVDSIHPTGRAKVVVPHPDAAAAVHPDLNNVYLATAELGQVPVVDIEVVPPLDYARSGQMSVEVRLKPIRRFAAI